MPGVERIEVRWLSPDRAEIAPCVGKEDWVKPSEYAGYHTPSWSSRPPISPPRRPPVALGLRLDKAVFVGVSDGCGSVAGPGLGEDAVAMALDGVRAEVKRQGGLRTMAFYGQRPGTQGERSCWKAQESFARLTQGLLLVGG